MASHMAPVSPSTRGSSFRRRTFTHPRSHRLLSPPPQSPSSRTTTRGQFSRLSTTYRFSPSLGIQSRHPTWLCAAMLIGARVVTLIDGGVAVGFYQEYAEAGFWACPPIGWTTIWEVSDSAASGAGEAISVGVVCVRGARSGVRHAPHLLGFFIARCQHYDSDGVRCDFMRWKATAASWSASHRVALAAQGHPVLSTLVSILIVPQIPPIFAACTGMRGGMRLVSLLGLRAIGRRQVDNEDAGSRLKREPASDDWIAFWAVLVYPPQMCSSYAAASSADGDGRSSANDVGRPGDGLSCAWFHRAYGYGR
ncbi:hypothetical protein R3P38DRAFT_3231112 [Favolaschia claudopus]|uniref:Uncharacterized protein n=1 Tax=Favolaschia claudopus TaxID=2862362 RepID=A0AAV9ZLG5_9AGAR